MNGCIDKNFLIVIKKTLFPRKNQRNKFDALKQISTDRSRENERNKETEKLRDRSKERLNGIFNKIEKLNDLFNQSRHIIFSH